MEFTPKIEFKPKFVVITPKRVLQDWLLGFLFVVVDKSVLRNYVRKCFVQKTKGNKLLDDIRQFIFRNRFFIILDENHFGLE